MAELPKTVAVCGLGFMGKSLAANLLQHGFSVLGYERDAGVRAGVLERVRAALDLCVTKGGWDASTFQGWEDRLVLTDNIKGAAWERSTFVIETVFEDEVEKASVFDMLEEVIPQDAIIASNTSGIPITKLQKSRKFPRRFVGMHFGSPCTATTFCEVTRGEATEVSVSDAVVAVAVRMGKLPAVLKKDVPGFLVNRLSYAMYREAVHLVDSGVCDPEAVDNVVSSMIGMWASLQGPFRMMDMTGGPSLYGKVMKDLAPTLCRETGLQQGFRAKEGTNDRWYGQYDADDQAHWEDVANQHFWQMHRLKQEQQRSHDEFESRKKRRMSSKE